jgi:hypothetical protein
MRREEEVLSLLLLLPLLLLLLLLLSLLLSLLLRSSGCWVRVANFAMTAQVLSCVMTCAGLIAMKSPA